MKNTTFAKVAAKAPQMEVETEETDQENEEEASIVPIDFSQEAVIEG